MDIENIDILVKDLTLKLFHVGSSPVNYKILTSLPSDIKTLMVILNLTKVPVNNKVNVLLKAGLVNREMGTGEVYITLLGNHFLELLDSTEEDIKKNFVDLIRKNLD